MKMRKLLAGSVAATIAVTSLATFASAEEKTFDMGYPNAGWQGNVEISSDIGKSIGASAVQTDMQKIEIKLASWEGFTDWDATETKTGTGVWEQYANWLGDIKLVVTGLKAASDDDDAKLTKVTKEYTFEWDSTSQMASIVVLPDTEPSYTKGEFAPSYFDIIETVELSFPFAGGTTSEEGYTAIKTNNPAFNVGTATVYNMTGATVTGVAGWYGKSEGTPVNANCLNLLNTEIAKGESGNVAASILAYALTNGGYSPSKDAYIEATVNRSISINKEYPFIAARATGANNTILRHDVQLLSDADDYNATTTSGGIVIVPGTWKTVKDSTGASVSVFVEEDEYFEDYQDFDANQSYDDNHMGDAPNMFAGLASQMADFFNKQTNGTVTFKFATGGSTGGSDWFTGGIPSTEVGIKNFLGDATTNDFALFVNYASSTGSLQALTSIDAAAGTVTFDISDILDAMSGQTIGVIQDVSFGLAKGATTKSFDSYLYDYENDVLTRELDDNGNGVSREVEGLLVQEVILAYGEDEDSATDIEDDDDDNDSDVTVDDDDDDDDDNDVTVDDDDDDDDDDNDVTVEDDDDDDKNVEGDVVTTPSVDDDDNPATGVALAVVPALVAAAAAVVSKKRK